MGSVRTIGFLFAIAAFLAVALVSPAILMRIEMAPYLYSNISDVPKTSVGLVLGASVVRGKPSPALAARTDEAAELFKSGKVWTLLVSGAVEPNYDEISAMRSYLLAAGIPAADIASDSAGLDTYSSVYRARNVFLADSLIIVSQDYHLPRAVFMARALHLKAYGIVAPRGARLFDYLREIPASWKALWDVITARVPEQSAVLAPLVIAGVRA